MPFQLALTPKEKEDLFRDLEDELHVAQGARMAFDKRRVALYNAYRNRVKRTIEPFEGASNFSLPLLTRAVDRMAVEFNEIVFPKGACSTIRATPVGGAALEERSQRGDRVGQFIGHRFHQMGLNDKMDAGGREFTREGNVVGKIWWCREEMKQRSIERKPAHYQRDIPDDESQDGIKSEVYQEDVEVTMDVMFQDRYEIEAERLPSRQAGYTRKRYTYFEPNEKRTVTVDAEGYYNEDSHENVILLEQRVLVKNRPEFEVIDLDHCYFTLDATEIENARIIWVNHPQLGLSHVKQQFRRKVFNQITEKDMEEIEGLVTKRPSGVQEYDMSGKTKLDRPAPVMARQDVVEGSSQSEESYLELWEVFARMDLDGDGEDEEVVVWMERRSRKILRVAHLFEDYFMNERPIVSRGFIPIGNRTLKIGAGEVIMPLLVVLNQFVNNRSNAAAVQLTPGGFFRPGSGFQPGAFRFKPGVWYPVDNPLQDAREFVFQGNTRDTIAIEQFLMALLEDLTLGTYTFGGSGGGGANTPRTARGTLAILQQDAVKLNYLLKRLLPFILKLCKKILLLEKAMGSEQYEFKVVGKNAVSTVSREDLEQDIEFYFELDSVTSNQEVRRILSAQALQGALPMAMMDPAMIPHGARTLVRHFLDTLDVGDSKEIIPDPPGFDRSPKSQEEEIQAMVHGIPVAPIMQDDHQGHLLVMDAFEQTPEFNSMPVEWVKAIWMPHKYAHVRFFNHAQQQVEQLSGGGGSSAQGGAMNGAAGVAPSGMIAGAEGGPSAVGSTFGGSSGGY